MAEIILRDGTKLGDNYAPYVIAELNSSHFGKLEVAKELMLKAKECGCNCVKFQSWTSDTLYSKDYYAQNPIMARVVKKFSLSEDELISLSLFAKELKIAFASTAYSKQEVDVLVEKCEAPFLKISSMEINNYDFLKYCANTKVPLILSTGMADFEEIRKAVELILPINQNLVLLHCISLYPVKNELINLNNIKLLQENFPNCVIGFSDHSLSTVLSSAAVALGARVIEKHFTLDKSKMGMDNNMAVEPSQMSELVTNCHEVFDALGSIQRKVSDEEKAQRLKMRRSLVLTRNLSQGSILQDSDLDGLRPGNGISIDQKTKYVGRVLKHDLEAGRLLQESDLEP